MPSSSNRGTVQLQIKDHVNFSCLKMFFIMLCLYGDTRPMHILHFKMLRFLCYLKYYAQHVIHVIQNNMLCMCDPSDTPRGSSIVLWRRH